MLALLIYPVVDATAGARARAQLFGKGFFLTDELMQWYTGHFLPEGSIPPTRCARRSCTAPEGLRAGLVVTAGFDPLRDEGEAYADALREPGCAVRARAASPGSSTASSTPSAPALLRATHSSKSQE